MNPMMFVLAFGARRRGATAAEVAPLLIPLSGPAGAMISAFSIFSAQRAKDALGKEMKALQTKAVDAVAAAEKPNVRAVLESAADFPGLTQLTKRRGVQAALQANAMDRIAGALEAIAAKPNP